MKHFVILNDAKEATDSGRAELKRRLEEELHLSSSLLEVVFAKLPAVVRVETDLGAANKLCDELEAFGAAAVVSDTAPGGVELPVSAVAAPKKESDAIEIDFVIDESALKAARAPAQRKPETASPADMQDILLDLEQPSPPAEASPAPKSDELPVLDSLLGFDEAAPTPEPDPAQTAAAALKQEEAPPPPKEPESEPAIPQSGGFQSGVQMQHSAPVNRANLILFAFLGLVLIGAGLFYLTGGVQQPTANIKISSDMIETLLLQQQQFTRESEVQRNQVSSSLTVSKEWKGSIAQNPYTYALGLSFADPGFFLTWLQITTPEPPSLSALEKVQKKKPPLWLREIVIEKLPNMLFAEQALKAEAPQPYEFQEPAFAYYEDSGRSGRAIVKVSVKMTLDFASRQVTVEWHATNLPPERAVSAEEILARSDAGIAINLHGAFTVVCEETVKVSSSSQSVSSRAP